MARTKALSGTVLLVAASSETDELLRDSTLSLQRASDAAEAISRVESGEAPDVVALDVGLDDPVRVAQRLHSLDRDGAVVVLADSGAAEQLGHALGLAPFLDGDVTLLVREDGAAVVQHLEAAAARTRERRDAAGERRQRRATPPPLSASYLGTLLDSVPIGLVTMDASAAVIGWNRRAGEMLEIPEVEVLGKPFADLFAESDRARLGDLIERLETAGISDDSETFERGGRWFELSGARFKIRSGEPGTLLILQDVSKRIVAEKGLRLQKALSDAQADTSLVGIVAMGVDGSFERANRRFYSMWGVEEEAIRADHERARQLMLDQVEDPDAYMAPARDLTDGHADEVRDEVTLKDGRVFERYATFVRDAEDDVVGQIWFHTDITEHRREEESLRLLADATNLLSSTLDYETTLESVVDLVVPRMADWCSVDMITAAGEENVALVHADPKLREYARNYRRDHPGSESDLVHKAIATGESQVVWRLDDEALQAIAVDDAQREFVALMAPRSLMIVPIKVRDRIFGAISFVRTRLDHAYTADDVRLAEELARRAAIAIDNSRVHAELRETARTLQESLLPPHLPGVRGLELAARFRPAGAGMQVGGDFYDIFETTPGRWAIAVGDVCGKGAKAAAVTALTRYTVRAAAMYEEEAGRVLGVLNTALLRQRGDALFTTLAYCVVDLEAEPRRLRASSAGHPRPLLLHADGSVEVVGAAGPLLGVISDAQFGEEHVELSDGDVLVMYTDGLTDALAPEHMLDEQDLIATLGECGGMSAAEISQRLEAAALAGDPSRTPRDDIALLVVGVG